MLEAVDEVARIEWFVVDGTVAQVGHSDLAPPGVTIGGPDRLSWSSAHETTGCTERGLAGRFYCFAAD